MPFDLMALRMMLLDLILPQKTLLRDVARLGGMHIVATALVSTPLSGGWRCRDRGYWFAGIPCLGCARLPGRLDSAGRGSCQCWEFLFLANRVFEPNKD